MGDWFGSTWPTVAFVALSTAATYLSVLIAVRLAGRRTLTQLSAFDVVVTIALGTMLSSTALSSDPSYAEGMAAIATLLALQVAIGTVRQRFPVTRRALNFEQVVVVRDGEPQLSKRPTGPQLTEDELRSALRERDVFDLENVALVILEPTGSFSVRRDGSAGNQRAGSAG